MARFKFKKRDAKAAASRLSGESKDPFLKSGTKIFKPADGVNNLRYMPPTWDDPKHYGYDIYIHYQVGPEKLAYLCPQKMKGEPCPVCESRQVAYDEGDDEYAKKLYPTRRVLAWVSNTKAPNEGVKAWPQPYKKVDQQIVLQSTDADTNEYFAVDDIDDGYNVAVTKTGTGLNTDYGISIARHSSAFEMTEELYDFLMENALPDILNFYDYEHIAHAFGSEAPAKEPENSKPERSRREKPKKKVPTTPAPENWEEIEGLDSEDLDLICKEHTQLDLSTFSSDEELREALADELEIEVPKADPPASEGDGDHDAQDEPPAKETFAEKMARIKAARK